MHKHKWQYMGRYYENYDPTKQADLAGFVCTCGKVRLVKLKYDEVVK